MNIIVAVTSTYKYPDRYTNILNTWAKKIDTVIIIDKDFDNPQFIKVTDRSDYESGVDKNLETIKYFYSIKDKYDYFIICDDDTYLNTNNIDELLKQYLNKNNAFGIGYLQNSFTPNKNLWYFSGGAGYILSKQAVIDSYNYITTSSYNRFFWGDVTLGYIFDAIKLEKIHSDLFSPTNSENVKDVTKICSFHYVKGEEFYKLYNMEKCDEDM